MSILNTKYIEYSFLDAGNVHDMFIRYDDMIKALETQAHEEVKRIIKSKEDLSVIGSPVVAIVSNLTKNYKIVLGFCEQVRALSGVLERQGFKYNSKLEI